jgi:hypothetical protein
MVGDGVKSPDLDGDCAVTRNDVAAALAALGSADFCAGLGGSGTVDVASGRLARNLRDATPGESADESRRMDWNGLDDHGRPVPSGIYAIQASVCTVQTQGSIIVLR